MKSWHRPLPARKVPAVRVDTKDMCIPAQAAVPAIAVPIRVPIRVLAVLFGMLGWPDGLLAAPLYFASRLDQSTWQVQTSDARCALQHPIPEYGTAVFARAARQALQLRIGLPESPLEAHQVTVRAVPPPWNHAARPLEFGVHPIGPAARNFELKGEQAQALFDALERGLNVEFAFGPAGLPAQAVVSLSPVRFQLAVPDFQTCIAKLGSARPKPAVAGQGGEPVPARSGAEAVGLASGRETPATAVATDVPKTAAASEPEPAAGEDPYIRTDVATVTPAVGMPASAPESAPASKPESEPEPEPISKPETKPETKPGRDPGAGLGLVEELVLSYAPTQDELSDGARIELGSFAREYLVQRRRDVVLIAGSAEHGQLTRRRALEIKGYLVRRGLPATHVLIHVQGEKLPQREGVTVKPPEDATRMSVWRVR